VTSLPADAPTGKPNDIRLLGNPVPLKFSRDDEGLKIRLPQQDPGNGPYVLRIAGLKLD
jgi:hypothetical protein